MLPRTLSAILFLAFVFSAAAHAEPVYYDDRTNPETLIRSLYNAINRKEFARAFSYFERQPAPSFEAYAAGFADTEHVEVVTGIARSDAGAGSIYYTLPVAIEARKVDGSHRRYAGCYTFHLLQPAAQAFPYRPLSIADGKLHEEGNAAVRLKDVLPEKCGEGNAASSHPLLENAQRLFEVTYGNFCDTGLNRQLEHYTINPSGHDGSPPTLFRFLCTRGAYAEGHIYLIQSETGELIPLQFSEPELAIQYENDDHESVEEIRVIGYRSTFLLTDSFFDPDELSIISRARWRGLGDASAIGKWLYRESEFMLVHYEVDASYDGEINPVTILDYEPAP